MTITRKPTDGTTPEMVLGNLAATTVLTVWDAATKIGHRARLGTLREWLVARLVPPGTAGRVLVTNGAGGIADGGVLLEELGGGAPAAHAASHATGSSDPITPASIGAATVAEAGNALTAAQNAQTTADDAATAATAAQGTADNAVTAAGVAQTTADGAIPQMDPAPAAGRVLVSDGAGGVQDTTAVATASVAENFAAGNNITGGSDVTAGNDVEAGNDVTAGNDVVAGNVVVGYQFKSFHESYGGTGSYPGPTGDVGARATSALANAAAAQATANAALPKPGGTTTANGIVTGSGIAGAVVAVSTTVIADLVKRLGNVFTLNADTVLDDSYSGSIIFTDTSGGARSHTIPTTVSAGWNAIFVREGANTLNVIGDGTMLMAGPAAAANAVAIAVDNGGVSVLRRSATKCWCAGKIS